MVGACLQVLDPQQGQMLRQQMDASTEQLLQRHMLAGSAVGTDWCALNELMDASQLDLLPVCRCRTPLFSVSLLARRSSSEHNP